MFTHVFVDVCGAWRGKSTYFVARGYILWCWLLFLWEPFRGRCVGMFGMFQLCDKGSFRASSSGFSGREQTSWLLLWFLTLSKIISDFFTALQVISCSNIPISIISVQLEFHQHTPQIFWT